MAYGSCIAPLAGWIGYPHLCNLLHSPRVYGECKATIIWLNFRVCMALLFFIRRWRLSAPILHVVHTLRHPFPMFQCVFPVDVLIADCLCWRYWCAPWPCCFGFRLLLCKCLGACFLEPCAWWILRTLNNPLFLHCVCRWWSFFLLLLFCTSSENSPPRETRMLSNCADIVAWVKAVRKRWRNAVAVTMRKS